MVSRSNALLGAGEGVFESLRWPAGLPSCGNDRAGLSPLFFLLCDGTRRHLSLSLSYSARARTSSLRRSPPPLSSSPCSRPSRLGYSPFLLLLPSTAAHKHSTCSRCTSPSSLLPKSGYLFALPLFELHVCVSPLPSLRQISFFCASRLPPVPTSLEAFRSHQSAVSLLHSTTSTGTGGEDEDAGARTFSDVLTLRGMQRRLPCPVESMDRVWEWTASSSWREVVLSVLEGGEKRAIRLFLKQL